MKDEKKKKNTEKQLGIMPEVWGVKINPHKTNVKIANPYSKFIQNNKISEIHVNQGSRRKVQGEGI